jgi:hypothetical protein
MAIGTPELNRTERSPLSIVVLSCMRPHYLREVLSLSIVPRSPITMPQSQIERDEIDLRLAERFQRLFPDGRLKDGKTLPFQARAEAPSGILDSSSTTRMVLASDEASNPYDLGLQVSCERPNSSL